MRHFRDNKGEIGDNSVESASPPFNASIVFVTKMLSAGQAMIGKIIACSALVALTACGGSKSGGTGFTTTLTSVRGNQLSIAEGGFIYEVGVLPDNTGFGTNATITARTSFLAPNTTGSATLTGTYQVQTLQQPVFINGKLDGTGLFRSNPIVINIDFDNKRLTGAADGLIVTGKFNAEGEMSGNATFDGMSGPMSGEVGQRAAVAAFQGSKANAVFAGGFVAD